jgi:hypothetical protein
VSRLISFLVLAFMALSSAALFLVALGIWLLTVWWDRRLAVLHRFTCLWASLYTWLIPAWPLTIEGKQNIRRGATYVLVSNHQSLLDVLMYFRLFVHFKWVSKAELFRVPFVGWNMVLNRYIPIRRGDPESADAMFERCRRRVEPRLLAASGSKQQRHPPCGQAAWTTLAQPPVRASYRVVPTLTRGLDPRQQRTNVVPGVRLRY